MDYFDDLNPYLVKEDDNENLTRQQTVQYFLKYQKLQLNSSILKNPFLINQHFQYNF